MTQSGAVSAHGQLPLAVSLRDEATLDNFLVLPGLAPPVSALQPLSAGKAEPFIFLHGPAGVGKSHLLQACCQEPGIRAQYLPLSQLRDLTPADVLTGLEILDLVCLDDVHAVAGIEAWELALFNFYNDVHKTGCRLLAAALEPPRALNVRLADLRSRLTSAVVYRLGEPSDEEKTDILCFRAQRRGMSLAPDVARYIVNRAPRALHDLLLLLDELDQASLARQRLLSIPFVREMLGW